MLRKVTVAQLVSKFPAFYGTLRSFTVKMAVFLDVAPCSLVDTDVSEELTSSVTREMNLTIN